MRTPAGVMPRTRQQRAHAGDACAPAARQRVTRETREALSAAERQRQMPRRRPPRVSAARQIAQERAKCHAR